MRSQKRSKKRSHNKASHRSDTPRAVCRISLDQLRSNFRKISRLVPHQLILPMVKADAYGHGACQVTQALVAEKKLYGFGVATLSEGIEIREQVRSANSRKIIVFSDTGPFTENTYQVCKRFTLTPVIYSLSDFKRFIRWNSSQKSPLPFELKFNTGMNRLGMPIDAFPDVISLIEKNPRLMPSAIMSHLACADNPQKPVSKRQLKEFSRIKSAWREVFPEARTQFHLANSAAIWNHRQWKLSELTDAVRPGLSLYGVEPWQGAKTHGIRPALQFETRVIQTHNLKKGETVGYGATYRAKQNSEKISIIATGYADGVHRVLSNQHPVWINGKKRPFIGVISMDMAAIRFATGDRPGRKIEILGKDTPIWKFAAEAGTIPYELLTSISNRVERIYESSRRAQR